MLLDYAKHVMYLYLIMFQSKFSLTYCSFKIYNNKGYLKFLKIFCFVFSDRKNDGCGLSTNAAYTLMFNVNYFNCGEAE